MIQLRPDTNIPSQIYELTSIHNIGMPLKKYQRRLFAIISLILIIAIFYCLYMICYDIYGYIAFMGLSHTYPNINDVPSNQVANYIQLQVLHDNFWQDIQQITNLLIIAMGNLLILYPVSQIKLYVCSNGMLKIYKKKDLAICWDEVKELHTTLGNVTKLVKLDGSSFELPALLMSGYDKTINTLILDEITRSSLPKMLDSYEHGGLVNFGDLEVSKKGIRGPNGMVYWDQIGDIMLEKGRLSVYYLELDKKQMGNDRISTSSIGKWHIWQKNDSIRAARPNLPIFLALVKHILDQRDIDNVQETPLSHKRQSRKNAATIAKYKNRRRKNATVMAVIMTILCIFSVLVASVTYQINQDQLRADRDLQLIRNHINILAHQPYYAHVPGQHCDHGQGFWYDDDDDDVYTCEKDGLLMTQRNMTYQDETYFTFDGSYQSTYTGLYIPHHYRVQVKATIVSGGPNTCISLHVHLQDFQGRQEFDVCADGSWNYSRCDLHCNTDTQVAGGQLPHAENSYLIAVDVTDSVLTLTIDNTKIASIEDNTYTSTDEIVLSLYGDQNAGEPITALFSDFLYTPYT